METIQSPKGGAARAQQEQLSTHSLPAFSRSPAAVAQLQHDAGIGADEPLATVSLPSSAPSSAPSNAPTAPRRSAGDAAPRPRPPPRRVRSQPGPVMGSTIHEGVVALAPAATAAAAAVADGSTCAVPPRAATAATAAGSACTVPPRAATAAAGSAGRGGNVRAAEAAARARDQEKEVEAAGDDDDCPGLWYACERLSELRSELKREQGDAPKDTGIRRTISSWL